MAVFEWDGRRLLGSYYFEPDEGGRAEFANFLEKSTLMPAQLVVDIVEEEFRRETVPHVYGSDRKAVIDRLKNRHYRDEPCVYVKNYGRIAKNRRYDDVLLGALTNTDLLTPWLEELDRHKVPLAGIWSLALLSQKIMEVVADDKEHALLISRQIRSALRESYFKQGKLVLSRQGKLDREARDNDSAQTIVDNLLRGTDQIHKFLTNQRIMGFTDPLNIYCLLPDKRLEDVRSICPDSALLKYQFIGLNSLFEHFKLENCEDREADVLFAYLCSQVALGGDHYAAPVQKSFYHRYVLDRAIGQAATLGALFFAVAAALVWLHRIELSQEKAAVELSKALLEQRHQNAYSALEERLVGADTVRETVALSQRIKAEAEYTPQRFFGTLSGVFSDPQFAALQLNQLLWKKIPVADVSELKIRYLDRLRVLQAEGGDNYSGDSAAEYSAEDSGELSGEQQTSPIQPTLTLIGKLERERMPYRDIVTLVTAFATRLGALPNVQEVQILRMPVDVRPPSRFSDEQALQSAAERPADADFFEIMLILAPAEYGGKIENPNGLAAYVNQD